MKVRSFAPLRSGALFSCMNNVYRSTFPASRHLLRVATLIVLWMVSTLAVAASASQHTDDREPVPVALLPVASLGLPSQCTMQYAALLDLAALARRYGRSSGVFADALDAVAGQLDDCLSQADSAGGRCGADSCASLTKGA
jgi:hypothetical protein